MYQGGAEALTVRRQALVPHQLVRDAYQVVFDNGTYAELMDQYGLSDIAVEKPVLHKGGA